MRYQERIDFRRSEKWQNFRQTIYDLYNGKDAITGEELKEDWNCHHLCTDHTRYDDISDVTHFVPLNRITHQKIHLLWDNGITKTEGEYADAMNDILTRMVKLNENNIEVVLFRNHIDYTFDESNKNFTCAAAKRLGLPTDRYGMIYWNPNTYGSDRKQPIETKKWIIYQHNKLGWNKEDAILALELRHLCLWSSLKNIIRPEVRAKWNINKLEQTEEILKVELINTTKILNNIRRK